MFRNTKVATCSYCGTRAALVLDEGRHELVCSACGAPLHELKAMPVARQKKQAAPTRRSPHPDAPPYGWSEHERARKPSKNKYRKRRKRKSLVKKAFEEAFDLIDDIFD